jgi:large subunit ribosomal protein L18
MVTTNAQKNARRARRKYRTRKNIFGTSERLRLTVYRSLNHIYAQIVDDVRKHTLATASSSDKEIKAQIDAAASKIEQSKIVGELLAKRAAAANVKAVVFDRNGYLYHGRVKALGDAAREHGLSF